MAKMLIKCYQKVEKLYSILKNNSPWLFQVEYPQLNYIVYEIA